jgi:hypothetical protein
VPSITALATSETSARVGIGSWIMDSIIWVAVITTRFNARATRMMFFCAPGTSAKPISTPRSPRATITTSLARAISSIRSTASARSILATSRARLPAACTRRRASSMSAAARGNDTARKSRSSSAAARISSRSLSVSAPAESPPPCRLMPLASDSSPPTRTRHSTREPATRSTSSMIAPSFSSSRSPGPTSRGRSL